MKNDPSWYMKKALLQAVAAARHDEVPIGAIVVDGSGKILARNYNRVEQQGSQTAHAEHRAIERACRTRGDWRLDDCTLFVTLEPCLMCYGLIHLSRIKKVYYAASSPLFGHSSALGKPGKASAYKRPVQMIGGLLEQESSALLKAFFKSARNQKRYI